MKRITAGGFTTNNVKHLYQKIIYFGKSPKIIRTGQSFKSNILRGSFFCLTFGKEQCKEIQHFQRLKHQVEVVCWPWCRKLNIEVWRY